MSARERADEDAIEVELGLSDFALVTEALRALEMILETDIQRLEELVWSQGFSNGSERLARVELKLDSLREARERIDWAFAKWCVKRAATGDSLWGHDYSEYYSVWSREVSRFSKSVHWWEEALAQKRDSCCRQEQ